MKIHIVTNRIKNIPIQAKAAVVFMVANFCNMGFNFISTPVFTRIMSESEIGVTSVFDTWRDILSVIITLNLSYGIYEIYLAKHENEKVKMTQSLVIATTIFCTLFAILLATFSDFFILLFDLKIEYLVILWFEIYSMSIVNFWMTQKRFDYDYKVYGIVIVCINFLKIALSLSAVMAFPSYHVMAKLLSWAFPYFIFALCLLFNIIHRWEGIDYNRYIKPAVLYNIVLLPHYLSNILLGSADKIIISRYVGDNFAGIYSIAVACSSAVSVVLSSIHTAFTPYTYKKLRIKAYKDINELSKTINLLVIGICGLAILVGPEIFKLFAPSSYYDGIDLLPPLIAGVYMTSLYALFSKIEFFYNYNRLTSIATMTGGVVNIVTNLWLIPIYGYKAAAYTTLFAYIIMACMHMGFYLYIARNKLIVTYDIRFLSTSSAVFLCMSIIIIPIYGLLIIRVAFILFICCLIIYKRRNLLQIMKAIKLD